MDDDGPIDPDDLDEQTVREVERAVRGFRTHPSKPRNEWTDYEEGRSDAFSAVLAMLDKWVDEMDDE